MSYKINLQSNNTNIKTIKNYVDAFGSLIIKQDNLITQIQNELPGKVININRPSSTDNIGVFTVDIFPDIKFLFIKGMTFKEFNESKINIKFYASDRNCYQLHRSYSFSIDDDIVHGGYSYETDDGSEYLITIDGNFKSTVTDDIQIEEREYIAYDFWGDES